MVAFLVDKMHNIYCCTTIRKKPGTKIVSYSNRAVTAINSNIAIFSMRPYVNKSHVIVKVERP